MIRPRVRLAKQGERKMKKQLAIVFGCVVLGAFVGRALEEMTIATPAQAQQFTPDRRTIATPRSRTQAMRPPANAYPPANQFAQTAPPALPTLQNNGYAATRFDSSNTANFQDEFTPEERVNIRVYELANRSVVNITTRIARGNNNLFWQNLEPAKGSGSGSILDRQGHVLTNHHVIEDAQSAMVTLYDGESYPAELVGADPSNDIAVLKIDAPADVLFPVNRGESSRLKVGQRVFAIGNPFGLERTLTVGILSSTNRSLPSKSGRTMKSILQIDAALNRGNSGGPLLDSRGRLIGMNTAIASPSGSGENTGIGFAIPASTLERVVPQLIRDGRVIRADAGIAQVYETRRGLLIAQLVEDGPAQVAGLNGFKVVRERAERGGVTFERTYLDRSQADLVVAVDGKPTVSADEFLGAIEQHQPGERAVVTVMRDDRKVDVPVLLGEDR